MGGFCRGGPPNLWADMYAFPKEKTYTILVYGEPACKQLIDEYKRRGQFFYNMYLEHDDLDPGDFV